MVRGRLIDVKQAALRSWRDIVMHSFHRQPPIETGPVAVMLDFYLPRPKAHYGTGRNAQKLRQGAPGMPSGKPDIDKLTRAVLDAMTGVAFHDDSQVCFIMASKNYATPERDPGVSMLVRSVEVPVNRRAKVPASTRS